MSTQAIVQVSDLQQGYGTKTVLSHINLTLNRGQILALIGPSGAGKTTLISTIMGMIRPRAGKVTVFNQHVPNRLLLGRIGFMVPFWWLCSGTNWLLFHRVRLRSLSHILYAGP